MFDKVTNTPLKFVLKMLSCYKKKLFCIKNSTYSWQALNKKSEVEVKTLILKLAALIGAI